MCPAWNSSLEPGAVALLVESAYRLSSRPLFWYSFFRLLSLLNRLQPNYETSLL
jgi:hypothetical protein